MLHHTWIVIEGDNGAGKDTLALGLAGAGWSVVNAHPRAVEALRAARAPVGSDRLEAYMTLNAVCGALARSHEGPAVLVRYWPSTVAAAFADEHIGEDDLPALIIPAQRLPQPDLFVRLGCDLPTRKTRISLRGTVDGRLDDVTAGRAERHRRCLDWIAGRFGRWACIDTTSLTPEQVLGQTLQILHSKDLLP